MTVPQVPSPAFPGWMHTRFFLFFCFFLKASCYKEWVITVVDLNVLQRIGNFPQLWSNIWSECLLWTRQGHLEWFLPKAGTGGGMCLSLPEGARV